MYEPTMVAAFAVVMRMPITEPERPARSSATGTYDPSSPLHPPAMALATKPIATFGCFTKPRRFIDRLEMNGGGRSRNNVGTMAIAEMPVAIQRAVTAERSETRPPMIGPITAATLAARFSMAMDDAPGRSCRTICV